MSALTKYFGQNVKVPYINSDSKGIFYKLREVRNPISTQDVTVTSKDFRATDDYCYIGLKGLEASCLIDGINNTAWANDLHQSQYPSFIITFKLARMKLEHYSIIQPCSKFTKWILKGSNNMIDWYTLDDREDETIVENSERFYSVYESMKSETFQYFNFSLTEELKRMHLNSIDFYGVLNPIQITCKQSINIIRLFFFYTTAFIYNNKT